MNSDWLPPGAPPPRRPLSLPKFLALLNETLQKEAVDLRAQHVAEVGFAKPSALAAVRALAAAGHAVLGGDVWLRGPAGPRFGGDVWAAKPNPGESWLAFVNRAAALSEEKIGVLAAHHGSDALFVLTTADEPEFARLGANTAPPR